MIRKIFILFLFFATISRTAAQAEAHNYNNRICIGLGAESSLMGIDYSGNIYQSKLFVGLGLGLGTGWTPYLRYEPINWFGLSPFISTGVSYTFGGTLVAAAGTSVFSATAGLNYLPKLSWRSVPVISIGGAYFSLIAGDTEGSFKGISPHIKIGWAF